MARRRRRNSRVKSARLNGCTTAIGACPGARRALWRRRALEGNGEPGEIDARSGEVARTERHPCAREIQVQAGRAIEARYPEVEATERDAPVGGRLPDAPAIAVGKVEEDCPRRH